MRFHLLPLTALLPLAGLLAGCALGTPGVANITPTPATHTISGKAFGGQQPLANASLAVYTYGTSTYGSTGSLVTTSSTDGEGNISFDLSCDAVGGSTPVYMILLGGNPIGAAANSSIALGASLGTCTNASNQYVTINEVSTTALAYALSHFFSATSNDGTTSDHFGGPGSTQTAIALANDALIPTLIDVKNGYPNTSTSAFTNESAKILTLADILGACVNSTAGDGVCSSLFAATTSPSGTAPTNTLEAAVNMALYPTQNVGTLYGLIPPSGSSAFTGSMAAQPADLTIAVSYNTSTLGVGLDSHTTTTLDIDTAGRVWFPSNMTGAAGVAYFDPEAFAFSPVFGASGLVRPEQVAIDTDGVVWTTDINSGVVAGFPQNNPASPVVLSIAGTTSTALTVGDDNSIRFAILGASTQEPALAEVTGPNTDAAATTYSYTEVASTTIQGSQGFVGSSLAGDTVGGSGGAATYLPSPATYDFYFYPNDTFQGVIFQDAKDAGQVVFTGNDFTSTRGGYNAADDGLCIYSQQNCFAMTNQNALRHPSGQAIDGAGSLWLADNFSADVQEVPRNGGSYLVGGLVNNMVLTHDANNGNTLTAPGGIGIDVSGNVWTTNIGCYATGCSPTGLVLTEIIGAGTPTVNPVSAQVVLRTIPGNRPSVVRSPSRAAK